MKQSYLRILVPAAAIAVAVLFVMGTFSNSKSAAPTAPAKQPAAVTPVPTPTAPAPAPSASTQATSNPAVEPAVTAQTAVTRPAVKGLHVQPAADPQRASLGSDQPGGNFKLKVDFTPYGAAILKATLADYNQTASGNDRYVVLTPLVSEGYRLFPLAARFVTVNGSGPVDLQNAPWELIAGESPNTVTYRINILDEHNAAVLTITRTYVLEAGGYDIRCEQQFADASAAPIQVVWEQNAQGDIPSDADYMGDQRQLVAGYFWLDYDPARKHIYTDKVFVPRRLTLDALQDSGTPFWPNPALAQNTTELAWFAQVNRYFTAVAHPLVAAPGKPGDPWQPAPWFNPQAGAFQALGMQIIGTRNKDPKLDTRRMVFTLTSKPLDLAPGAAARLDMALYAGPRKAEVFALPAMEAMSFSKLIVYQLSCAWCTFQPVAKALLWFLKGIHYAVRDWGVAIIILVIVVRGLLHPITKRSQINMTKMGKQMATMQPEIEKLKKKYKDDQTKLNSEMMALYRERGVNPANMLGCLPMLLQTPIWIALYAMLYFAIELRHQPAFYGVCQAISGGHWGFLGDLSSQDNFIRLFKDPYEVNLFILHPNLQSINVLPLLMAVVYYFQQKLMSPPPANEQAAQQQKMMKWMTLLFPVMLYGAPSGLNLYILASTGAGIVDSLIVRRHIKREEEAGTLFKKKEPGTGGWRERLQQTLEAKQRAMLETQKRKAPPRRHGE